MQIKVTQVMGDILITRYFDADRITKVLQSGALRVSRALEADVPVLGDAEADMVVTKELTIAVFNGEYVMERVPS